MADPTTSSHFSVIYSVQYGSKEVDREIYTITTLYYVRKHQSEQPIPWSDATQQASLTSFRKHGGPLLTLLGFGGRKWETESSLLSCWQMLNAAVGYPTEFYQKPVG